MTSPTRTALATLALLGGLSAAQTTPGQTIPAQAAPSAAQPGAAVLLPTALPGTLAEYTLNSQTAIQLLDLHYEAKPGQTVRAADLAAANTRLQARRAQMEAAYRRASQTTTTKSFVKVLPARDGQPVLLSTSIVPLPDAEHPDRQTNAAVSTTVVYGPDGQVTDVSVSSSDARLQRYFQSVDLQTLIRNSQNDGATAIYGLPLTRGEVRSRNVTFPMQGIVQSLGSLGGAEAASSVANIQASPVVIHTQTRFTGNDAAGNSLFSQTYTIDPWKLQFGKKGGDAFGMQMAVNLSNGGGSTVVRPDGLLQAYKVTQALTMTARIDSPLEPYSMVMALGLSQSTAQTLKGVTLP
ncbi:hypothetical protein [Deinococcus aquiradiocola]|uniref:Uncharacterized protein n=1 Tax=Deinococcus aquiradiocola TaxID=393059 RepID=A0A917PRV5_9DEIO|nr:hypothetical protein [Deinococcus aquiradiocola]GGJ89623.1 hypothetical protein GCM10008939_37000 [Deinococcus aquiradiocola]